ncbi:MAG: helix-turn-helix domain-containing protein [Treponema sp.]|jgi:SOS-response transcriptional repressor LexA|nr:helix-turn-helix domain-containing protein [Treponema sp.]
MGKKDNILILSTRLRNLREAFNQTQAEFAKKLDIPRTSLANYENGTSIPGDLLCTLKSMFTVNVDWFLTGEGEMFSPKKPEKHPLIADIEALIDKKLEKVESQIAQIEGQLKKKGMDGPDSGMFVSEPEPEYGDEDVKTPFVDDIAAGPPIQQSEDLSGHINVPRRFIKTKPEDYYAARIRGESMTAAGIPDGCTVLIRRSDVPRDGAIQVVRREGSSTLKRMREGEDHTWTLHFEDGSKWSIAIGKDEDYQVQGDFVVVLPERD